MTSREFQDRLGRRAKRAGVSLPPDLAVRLEAYFRLLESWNRKINLTALVKDDEALAEHIRQNVAGMFHVAGTCRMGASTDRDAVVDRAGRVRGFDGLRVVDASIMPTVPRANTNIPTIMVAEKISAGMAAGL